MLSGAAMRKCSFTRRSPRGAVEAPFVSARTMREYRYFVYMMQSTSCHALYIGMTSRLVNRVWQHKHDTFDAIGLCTTRSTTRSDEPSHERNS
jgi:hypothetical protein